jgi:branched-chain amino acid transport system substrate-binding protein
MSLPTDEAEPMSRRTFLRIASHAAGISMLGMRSPVDSAFASEFASGRRRVAISNEETPVQIGVILPQSSIAPHMGPNLLIGLRLAFAETGNRFGNRSVALVTETYGVKPAQALRQAHKLLTEDRVDVLVGAVSRHDATSLAPLLQERGTPLIVTDVGANIIRQDRLRPLVFRNSLNHWRASWALGRWAAANVGKRALIAASFYDSGYDTIYAFQRGFEQAGGRKPHVHVTHLPNTSHDLRLLIDAIRQTQPDFVFAAYCGPKAVDFVRAYAAAGVSQHIPLLGSSFLVDESLLSAQGAAAAGVITACTWAPALAMPEQHAFSTKYRAFTGETADSFAALGYDTGRMLVEALQGMSNATPESISEQLAALSFAGSRGSLMMHTNTRDVLSPIYLQEVRMNGRKLQHAVMANLSSMTPIELGSDEAPEGPKTGWLNAYLCV